MNSIDPCHCGGVAFIDWFGQYAPVIRCKRCEEMWLFQRPYKDEAISNWNKQQATKGSGE